MATLSAGTATPARNRTLLVLFLGVFMAALDTAIVAPAVPVLRGTFGVDNSQITLITLIYVLFALSSTAPLASLSDRYGRRATYLACVIGFGAASALIALAPNFGWVLVGRALQGLCAGGVTPAASAMVGDSFPPEERGKALGLLGATFGMAFLIGPMLASLVLLTLSWHWLFLINLPVVVLIVVMGMRHLPSTRNETTQPFDLAGSLVGFLFLTCLSFGINGALDDLLSLSLRPWLLLGAALFFALLIGVERRAARPLIPLGLFRVRQLSMAYAISLGAGFGMGSIFFITSLAVAAFGIPQQQAGFWLIPMIIASSVASVSAGRALNRTGSRAVMMVGFAAVGLGSLLLGLFPAQLVSFFGNTILIGFGVGVVVGGTLRYVVLNEVNAEQRAAAQGLINIFTSVGNMMVLASLGSVADGRGGGLSGYSAAYLVAGGVGLLMVLACLGLKNRVTEQRDLAAAA